MALLTTIDNPFNPYSDFQKWYDYDCNILGYNSSAYLDRIKDLLLEDSKIKKHADIFEDFDHFVQNLAIAEIIKYDPFGIYIKAIEPKTNSQNSDQILE